MNTDLHGFLAVFIGVNPCPIFISGSSGTRNSQFRSGIRVNKVISLQFTLNCHAERSLRP